MAVVDGVSMSYFIAIDGRYGKKVLVLVVYNSNVEYLFYVRCALMLI